MWKKIVFFSVFSLLGLVIILASVFGGVASAQVIITNVTNKTAMATTVWIQWNVSVEANNTVEYSINSDLSNSSWSSWDNETANPRIKLWKLIPNTTYYYRVKSINTTNSSDYNYSQIYNFTTPECTTYEFVDAADVSITGIDNPIQEAIDMVCPDGGVVELNGSFEIYNRLRIMKSNFALKGQSREKTNITLMSLPTEVWKDDLGGEHYPAIIAINMSPEEYNTRVVNSSDLKAVKGGTSCTSFSGSKGTTNQKSIEYWYTLYPEDFLVNVSFENFSLISGISGAIGIYPVLIKGLAIKNVGIYDFSQRSLYLQQDADVNISNIIVDRKAESAVKGIRIRHVCDGILRDGILRHTYGGAALYDEGMGRYDGLAIIENFTIINVQRTGMYLYGGAVDTIVRDIYINNVGGSGDGAVEINGAKNILLENFTIKGLPSGVHGVKIWHKQQCYNITFKNSITDSPGGHGIYCWPYGAAEAYNFTFKNLVIYNAEGDGVHNYDVYILNITNSIIINSAGYGLNGTNISSRYNNIWNNTLGNYKGSSSGVGDISVDPLFADPESGDFHLKSGAGRWNGSAWVYDSETSPCIDAGDPEDDYSNEPEPNGERINLGAYGNTVEASKSGVIVTAPANKWTSFRMHPKYNLTFEQISANLTNHLALSYYNKSIGLWQSYWVGYDFNKNVVVPERESLFAYFTADTNLICGIYAPKAKPLKAETTTPLYLRSFGSKKISEIKSALESDGCSVVQICGWDKTNQEWNCSDDFVVHPSEGFIVKTSNDCVWGEEA